VAAFHLLEFVSLPGPFADRTRGCRRMEALAAQYNPMTRFAIPAIGTSSGAVDLMTGLQRGANYSIFRPATTWHGFGSSG
jgi:hypothetical protein